MSNTFTYSDIQKMYESGILNSIPELVEQLKYVPKFRYGTVVNVDPLSVKVDGDEEPLSYVPVRVAGTDISEINSRVILLYWNKKYYVMSAEGFADAPEDDKIYGRQNGQWTTIQAGDGLINFHIFRRTPSSVFAWTSRTLREYESFKYTTDAGANITLPHTGMNPYEIEVIPDAMSKSVWVDADIENPQFGSLTIEAPYLNYPIDTVYTSISNINPASTLGGGVWEPFGEGRVLVGVGDNGEHVYTEPGVEGGTDDVQLTVSEMPQHTHIQNPHTHSSDGYGVVNLNPNGGGRIGSGVIAAHWAVTIGTTTATNQNTGGGEAHENRMPFVTVYRWVRTA